MLRLAVFMVCSWFLTCLLPMAVLASEGVTFPDGIGWVWGMVGVIPGMLAEAALP